MKLLTKRSTVVLGIIVTLALVAPIFAEATSVGGVEISSRSAVVMDFETGIVLWGHNEDTQRVPASMIKMVAVHVVYDAIKDGRATLDTRVTISQGVSALSRDTRYSNVAFLAGSTRSVRQLLEVVIVRSASAATVALGEGVFGSERELVRRMNEKAADLGVRATIVDCWGLSPDNRISARGMAEMSRALIQDHPEVLRISAMPTVTFDGQSLQNSNLLLGEYSGLDGLKTGYTDPAGYCFIGTARRSGRRLISVTMGSTLTSRYPDTRALLNHGFAIADEFIADYQSQPDDSAEHPVPGTQIFTDVSAAHWAYEEILEAFDRGLMSGREIFQDGSLRFAPSESLTRAEVAQILFNAYRSDIRNANSVAIEDVDGSAWFSPAIRWLVGNGLADLASADDSHFFHPNVPATRVFMADTLFRISVAIDVALPELSQPMDFPDVEEEHMEFTIALQQSGVITGYQDGTFGPDNTLLREQAAALMVRFTSIDGLETAIMREIAAMAAEG